MQQIFHELMLHSMTYIGIHVNTLNKTQITQLKHEIKSLIMGI